MGNTTIGDNIRKQRKRRGLSQEEFAEAIGVSRQTVSNWESGKVAPTSENIDGICNIFDMSYEELKGDGDAEDKISDRDENRETEKHEDTRMKDSKKSKNTNMFLFSVLGVLAVFSLAVLIIAMIIIIPVGEYDRRTFAFSFGFGEEEILMIVLIVSAVIFFVTTSVIIRKLIKRKER